MTTLAAHHPSIRSRTLMGANNRFCLTEFATRFGTVEWMVTDAERITTQARRSKAADEVVYQGTREGALAYIAEHDDGAK